MMLTFRALKSNLEVYSLYEIQSKTEYSKTLGAAYSVCVCIHLLHALFYDRSAN